ncbi:LysR substrate-binding domain-containing protein [Limibacillus halophilus]|uniref:DNA-binding transcriptional LysR family regulator n=1 Tax=Limibacillus halophilus TaxID=1579333 RepID=A0A839SZA5_9PROT|nr:LysR substrate-binding domain-containing protein [Limibacillus halophilus]MBB3066253.1 DNA-binding transcriptional LysR family regulator [Limibacillus halophilus]
MRRSLPSTTALLCFEAAARSGSFTQAAVEVNLSQSAVSRQIAILENFLHRPLFTRVRQRVRLTDAGARYLAEIVPLLEDLESTTLRLRSFDLREGSINVGVYPTLGSRWLLPLLLAFAEAHPEFSTNSITYLRNEEFDPERIDIGIVQGDPPWRGLQSDFLMPEDLAPVASPRLIDRSFDAPEELLEFRSLQHTTRPLSWPIWFKSLGRELAAPPSGLMFSQFEMVIEAALSGHGIAILPLVLVRRELAAGRLILAHSHVARPQSAYYLVIPDAKRATPKIECFRRWILSHTIDERAGSEEAAGQMTRGT